MADEIAEMESQILDMKRRLAVVRRAQPPLPLDDFTFASPDGQVRLSQLFGDGNDLLFVHNMGTACFDCTLWADGFNGIVPEILSRSGFVLVSPDPISIATDFARQRGWRMRVVSDTDRAFSIAVGRWQDDAIYPGISGLHRNDDGTMERIATADLGEGDDFCAVWHMLDLLKGGWAGWTPNYRL